MKRNFKLFLLVLMMVGIIFSIINFISFDSTSNKNSEEGTVQSDGSYSAGLNC